MITQGYEHPAKAGASDERGVGMKRSINSVILVIALGFSAPLFAGPFEKFFQSTTEPGIEEYVLPGKSVPRVVITDDLTRDILRIREDGYEPVGYSSFVGPPQDPKKAIKQAKKLKAEIIVYASTYESTRSGAMPILIPNNRTTTLTGNAYGSGGWGSYSGTASTYGSTPVVVPFSVDRYNQTAVYFAKIRPEKIGLGLRYSPLDPVKAKELGTNKAVIVEYVIRQSPAFLADIFSGDVVLSVAGRDISSPSNMAQIKADFAGKTVPVEIVRDGQKMTLSISVPVLMQSQSND